jgi:mRNA-degrading endonuclease YafQ of YafQ-DinJ toxin-antitoxin module
MILARHKIFDKHFKTRVLPNKNLIKRFEGRLELFLEKPNEPILKDHKLIGKMKNN